MRNTKVCVTAVLAATGILTLGAVGSSAPATEGTPTSTVDTVSTDHYGQCMTDTHNPDGCYERTSR